MLLDDLLARGRISSKDISKDKLAKVSSQRQARRAFGRRRSRWLQGRRAAACRALALTMAPFSRAPCVLCVRCALRSLQMLVSEYIRFPKTNASFPLNYCLVYDFMPSAVQQLMSPHCMTA